MAIGDKLRELRMALDKTQAEVAEAVGISRSYLAGLERGHERPSVDVTLRLADFFRVSIDYLLGRDGERRDGSAE
ncbi:MAG: helix-turn-helix transcriptional regulator [Pseudomonadota bacterium]